MAETFRKDVPIMGQDLQIINKTGITRTKRTGTVAREIAVATFDTAANDSSGTANTTAAAHGLGVYLPTKAIVTNAWYDVVTTFQSTAGGTDLATIALKVEGTGDLVAALSIATTGDIWDAGIHGCLPGSYLEATVAGDTAILDAARKAASYVKTTAVRELTATVATAALTAGKLNLYVEYVLSE